MQKELQNLIKYCLDKKKTKKIIEGSWAIENNNGKYANIEYLLKELGLTK